ncbi:unnamed protein product [Ixodes hexagonus]
MNGTACCRAEHASAMEKARDWCVCVCVTLGKLKIPVFCPSTYEDVHSYRDHWA